MKCLFSNSLFTKTRSFGATDILMRILKVYCSAEWGMEPEAFYSKGRERVYDPGERSGDSFFLVCHGSDVGRPFNLQNQTIYFTSHAQPLTQKPVPTEPCNFTQKFSISFNTLTGMVIYSTITTTTTATAISNIVNTERECIMT